MSRLFAVVRREYVERVRSRVFLFATLMGPLFMVVLTVVPGLLMEKQRGRSLRIAVVDETGLLKRSLEHALGEQRVNGQSRFEIVPAEESLSVL